MSDTILPLPTAASSEVRQRWSRVRKADREALLIFPASRSLSPVERDALNRAKRIRCMARTPELMIATAIFRAMEGMDRLKVQAFVAMAAQREGETALEALEWLRVIDDDNAASVRRALEKLESGEWE